MYNEEILVKIIDQFGLEEATKFCEIASTMYDIKFGACKNEQCFTEYDFERSWWKDAETKLKTKINI
jgi:hypothetical protein